GLASPRSAGSRNDIRLRRARPKPSSFRGSSWPPADRRIVPPPACVRGRVPARRRAGAASAERARVVLPGGPRMKAATWLLPIAAFGGGVGVGRLGATRAVSPCEEVATLASFEQGLVDPDWITRTWRMSGWLQGLGPGNLDETLALVERERRFLGEDELRLFM